MPGPGVEDGAGVGGVAVGEHGAPVHRPQQLEVLLALVRVPHSLTLPQNTAKGDTVLTHKVRAATISLTQAVAEIGLWPRHEGVAGVEVAVGQEAAAEAGAVVAPVAAVLLDTAHLLTQEASAFTRHS